MLVYRAGKWPGWLAMAPEREAPVRTSPETASTRARIAGFASSAAIPSRDCGIGMPASTNAASSREKAVISRRRIPRETATGDEDFAVVFGTEDFPPGPDAAHGSSTDGNTPRPASA